MAVQSLLVAVMTYIITISIGKTFQRINNNTYKINGAQASGVYGSVPNCTIPYNTKQYRVGRYLTIPAMTYIISISIEETLQRINNNSKINGAQGKWRYSVIHDSSRVINACSLTTHLSLAMN